MRMSPGRQKLLVALRSARAQTLPRLVTGRQEVQWEVTGLIPWLRGKAAPGGTGTRHRGSAGSERVLSLPRAVLLALPPAATCLPGSSSRAREGLLNSRGRSSCCVTSPQTSVTPHPSARGCGDPTQAESHTGHVLQLVLRSQICSLIFVSRPHRPYQRSTLRNEVTAKREPEGKGVRSHPKAQA